MRACFFFVKSTSVKSFQAESFTASSNQSLKTTTPRRLIDFFRHRIFFNISFERWRASKFLMSFLASRSCTSEQGIVVSYLDWSSGSYSEMLLFDKLFWRREIQLSWLSSKNNSKMKERLTNFLFMFMQFQNFFSSKGFQRATR